MRHQIVPLAVSLFLAVLTVGAASAPAAEPLRLAPTPPDASAAGSYTGKVRIALGEISDDVFADDPRYLGIGMGTKRLPVLLEEARPEAFAAALEQVLIDAGLLAGQGTEADYVVDAAILRDRVFLQMPTGFGRGFSGNFIRSEFFVRFDFYRQGEATGRVLACGNAQSKSMSTGRKKMSATYQYAIDDALFKLLESETLARLVGEGWRPEPLSRRTDGVKITAIDRDKFYGPSRFIQKELEKAAAPFRLSRETPVILVDFAVKDEKYLEEEDADPEFASRYLPALVADHLESYYPGALVDVRREGAGAEVGEGLVLNGELLRFKVGNVMTRAITGALIGFWGQGSDKLTVEVSFQDGSSGEELVRLDFKETIYATGSRGRHHTREMAEQLATDLAFFLVSSLGQDYSPPAEVEVMF